jgi:hypothetical protein
MNAPAKRKGFIVRGRSGDPESIYDTVVLLSTVQQTTLFKVPVNGAAGKTLDLTNMEDSGKLPTGKSLYVQSVNTYVFVPGALNTAGLLALYATLSNTTVEFIRENRSPSFTRTVAMLLGASVLAVVTPTVAGDTTQPAMPFYTGKMKIHTRALDLGANQAFQVRVTHQVLPAAALDNVKIKIEFDGLMSKKLTE